MGRRLLQAESRYQRNRSIITSIDQRCMSKIIFGNISIKEIIQRGGMSEDYPQTTLPLLNKLRFYGMTDYGYDLIPGTAPEINDIESHTKSYLHHLTSTTNSLPYHAKPISLEEYLKEFKKIRESTSYGPSYVTIAMVKNKALDPKLEKRMAKIQNYLVYKITPQSILTGTRRLGCLRD